MKSRLGAVVCPLLIGQHRRSISKSISAKRRPTSFNADGLANSFFHIGTLANPQLQDSDSPKRSLHSSVDDEDEFFELGAPVTQNDGKLPKLVTEKPEPYRKIDPVKKVFSGRSLPAENSPRLKDVIINRVRTSQAELKLENNNDGCRFTVNTKNSPHIAKSSSITIEDVPSTVGLTQLIEAISIFGEVSRTSMRTVSSGLGCCDVEFKNVESSRRAVSVGGITVRSFHLPIRPLPVRKTLSIRIKNIGSDTAIAAIHSKCMSLGSLEGLTRTTEDAVYAFYNVKDDLESQIILKKLNDTVTDDRRWLAHLLPRDSNPTVMSSNEDSKCKLGLQISSHLAELIRQVCIKKIHAEDLEYLHMCIHHLEDTPGITND